MNMQVFCVCVCVCMNEHEGVLCVCMNMQVFCVCSGGSRGVSEVSIETPFHIAS